ncbi:MAG: single-stranded DNA-binding protein [Lentisphaerae bacterium]|nr:single-stranded DNA-binding protein [Lentisphaerota bacterium]
MASLNKVFLLGNLTRDPELRQLPSGTAICTFALAINRSFTTTSGEPREEVCYVEMTAMGRQGETIAQYMRKGSPLFVEGRLHFEQWEDRETNKRRSRLSVRVERAQFIGAPATPQQTGGYPQQPGGYPQQTGGYPQQPGGYPQQPAAGIPGGYGVPPAVPKAPPAMPAFRPMPSSAPPAPADSQDDFATDEPLDDIPF